MTSTPGVRRNTLFALLAQTTRLMANFVLFIGLARMYGPADFGKFTAIHTLAGILILFADFGLDVLTSTEIARSRTAGHSPTGELLLARLLLATGAGVAMILGGYFQGSDPEGYLLAFVFGPFVFFSSVLNFVFAVFKGHEQLQHEAVISGTSNFFLFIAALILGLAHAPILMIAIAFVLSRIIGVLMGFRALRTVDTRIPSRSIANLRRHAGKMLVFGLHSILGTLYFTQDTLLLSYWSSDRVVGIYQSAFKVVALCLLVADVTFYTMLPVLTRLYETDRTSWTTTGSLIQKTLLFVSLPVGLILLVFPADVIQMLYGGAAYQEAIPILRMFGFTVVVRYAVDTAGTMLTSSNRQSRRLIVVAFAVVFNFVINAIVIPSYGAFGAACVSLATNICVGLGYVMFARDVSLKWLADARMWVPLVSALALGVWASSRSISFGWLSGPLLVGAIVTVTYWTGYSRAERRRLFSLAGVFRR
jgi:O-antigen/teichoic acid export membrane protein